MYDIQLSERNIVIEKSGLIGVFVQQNYSQTNAPRVQASGCHSFIHSYSFNLKKLLLETALDIRTFHSSLDRQPVTLMQRCIRHKVVAVAAESE